ncbi:MAG: glycosyltransferase [Acidimicrobiales bacterium]
MTDLAGRRLVHLASTDVNLVHLLGPLLRAFADADMEVIGVSAPGPLVVQLADMGVRHVPLRHSTRSVSAVDELLAGAELTRLFTSLRPDIVHTHESKTGLLGRFAARVARVPGIVNTVHGLSASPEDRLHRKVAAYGLERLAATCSRFELVENPEDLALLSRLGVPADHLVPLGGGVDLQRFQPRRTSVDIARARAALGIDPSAVVAGTVGRLVWHEGFRDLFATAARMRDVRPEVVFAVVGPLDAAGGDALGPGDIAAGTALGNVVFTGDSDDVEDLHPGFDIFVLPSYSESVPQSAMEAAASGLPVVASDIRGFRRLVDSGGTGLLVPLHDVDALVAAVAELAADPARRGTMGARARAKAEAEFDILHVIRTTLDIYRRLPVRRPERARPG